MKPITWKDRAKALMKANRELGKQNTRLLRLLEESESRKNWAYSELLKANQEITRLANYDLICKIKKLEVENAAPKSQKSSIYTDPEKCRTKPTEGVSV